MRHRALVPLLPTGCRFPANGSEPVRSEYAIARSANGGLVLPLRSVPFSRNVRFQPSRVRIKRSNVCLTPGATSKITSVRNAALRCFGIRTWRPRLSLSRLAVSPIRRSPRRRARSGQRIGWLPSGWVFPFRTALEYYCAGTVGTKARVY